jgi:restriction endonuclease
LGQHLLAVAPAAWHNGSIMATPDWDDRLNVKSKVGPRPSVEFENEVAEAYRALGAVVEPEIAAAGVRIDLLVRDETRSGSPLKLGVECKAYSQPLDANAVHSFAAIASLLKERGFIHRGVVVAASGFTKRARDVGEEQGIDLLELRDLKARLSKRQVGQPEGPQLISPTLPAAEAHPSRSGKKRLFVAMPFSKDFRDAYVFGIRQVSEKLGLVAERADEIEHNGGILGLIQDRIRDCDAMVADVTSHNPNVFYEIGYSHAIGRPTILIGRKSGDEIPFDLRTTNHITYETLEDLQVSLEKRLRATLSLPE